MYGYFGTNLSLITGDLNSRSRSKISLTKLADLPLIKSDLCWSSENFKLPSQWSAVKKKL